MRETERRREKVKIDTNELQGGMTISIISCQNYFCSLESPGPPENVL